MEKNKKIVWGIVAVILLAAAFMLGQERGWNAGTADAFTALEGYIYPPVDPYAGYVPPINPIYPPADAGTAPIPPAPIYPPIYPPMP